MSAATLRMFKEIVLVDFEFHSARGDLPRPLCMVAWELRSGRKHRAWLEGVALPAVPPYPTGKDSLIVAYYASAEVGCHLALGWPTPERVLDLHAEFRCLTNGQPVPGGNGLLGAMTHVGLDAIGAVEKSDMRSLAMRGGPFTDAERAALLQYCESDVVALSRLLPALEARLDLPRALLRGRYMSAAAQMEQAGIPIDTLALAKLKAEWPRIQQRLIAEIDSDYGVFDGTSLRRARLAEWASAKGIDWPRLPSGQLDMKEETFKELSLAYPEVGPLRELVATLSQLRSFDLPVGRDGRNRTILSAFAARTSRNQPSTNKFVFGLPAWLRALVRPDGGRGLAYVDWSQQEFGIAAALSGDREMMTAYESGDPYLEFAKLAGAVPRDATKSSHASVREQFKACVLGVQYSMGEQTLARRIRQPVARARELLDLHRSTFPKFWRWSDAVVDHGMMWLKLTSAFGWPIHVDGNPNPRFLRNFPMQANGAEMLRLACCLITEAGVTVCAPVHDAILIEADLGELDDVVMTTQALMAEASSVVLDGFRLRSDAKVVRHPERYMDDRGANMWRRVCGLIGHAP